MSSDRLDTETGLGDSQNHTSQEVAESDDPDLDDSLFQTILPEEGPLKYDVNNLTIDDLPPDY